MSTDPQSRIIAEIERYAAGTVVARHGNNNVAAVVVRKSEWANTGWLGFIRPGELVPTRRARYDFQDNYATFTEADADPRNAQRWSFRYADGNDAAADTLTQLCAWISEPIAIAYV